MQTEQPSKAQDVPRGPKKHLAVRCLSLSQVIRKKVSRLWELLESSIAMGFIDDGTIRRLDTYPLDETEDIQFEDQPLELEPWERKSAATHFDKNSPLLIVPAGGLRELVALEREGHDVHGVEFGQGIFDAGTDWLEGNSPALRLTLADRYEIPESKSKYGGAFISRQFYSHVRKKELRIQLLKNIREQIEDGGSLLISYYIDGDAVSFRCQATIANFIRRIICSKDARIEVGDHFDPDSLLCHHHFTDSEVADELREAGFELVEQNSTWLGWSLAKAVPQPSTTPTTSPAFVASPAASAESFSSVS